MSFILNIDTSSEQAHVSLSIDGVLLQTIPNNSQKEHASFLQPAIKMLMDASHKKMSELDAIAVVNGPGSYTGLRVALASAKGLCFVLKIPLISIGTLPLMAQSVLLADQTVIGGVDLICPMIDARRLEVFTAVFNLTLREVVPSQAMQLTENSFQPFLDKKKILFFGSGAAKWQTLNKNVNALFAGTFDTSAAMAKLTHQQYLAAQFTDLAYSEPLYLKEFYTGT